MAKWLTEQEYLKANKELNELGGEKQTNFNRAKIKSILSEVNQQADLESAGMILYFRTVHDHPFRGANRRTAMVVTGALLERNSITFAFPEIGELQTLNQRIRDGRISIEEFEKIYNEKFLNRNHTHRWKTMEEFEQAFRKVLKRYKWLVIELAKPAVIKPEDIDKM